MRTVTSLSVTHVLELNCEQFDMTESLRKNMARTTTTIDQSSSLALPPEAVDALGVEAGAELDVEIIGRALVVRSVEEARRSREFIETFESMLQRRRMAYERLAEGPKT